MKLNLLPKTVGTEFRSRNAAILGFLLFAGVTAASVVLVSTSRARLERSEKLIEEAKPASDRVIAAGRIGDDAMAQPGVRTMAISSSLAEAMLKHNAVYPNFYNKVIPYIPKWFRITNLAATPNDATTCTLSMTGYVKTYQEYADLMLALLRMPGAQRVSRAGWNQEDAIVPALTSVDQNGRPRKLSEGPIPDDALDRLAYFQQRTEPSGYLQMNGFGIEDPNTAKGAPLGSSEINVTVIITENLTTPNPRATLASIGAAPAPGATATGAPAAGGAVGGAPTVTGSPDVDDLGQEGR